MGFSRQEYWSGLPFPSPEDLPDPGTEPRSPAWQADSLPFELQGNPKIGVNNNLPVPPLCNVVDFILNGLLSFVTETSK